MTGEHFPDRSDSAGTLWLDVARRDWNDEMLAATRLTRAAMPGLVEGSEPAGMLRTEVAEAWGVRRVPGRGRSRRPGRRSGAGSSTAARRRCRSAPPACCSSPTRSTGPTPSAPSTVFLQLDALRAEGIEPGPSASFALQLPSASGSGPPASCASPTGAPSVVIRTSPLRLSSRTSFRSESVPTATCCGRGNLRSAPEVKMLVYLPLT